MANGVTYSDEKTLAKVYTALAGDSDLTLPQVLDAVNRLQNAGILFREPAEERTRRTPQEEAADKALEDTQAESPSV